MTQEEYDQMKAAFEKTTQRLLKSPEAARQFFIDAGIDLEDKPKKKQRRSSTKKKT